MGVVGCDVVEGTSSSVSKNSFGLYRKSNRTKFVYWPEFYETANTKKSDA